MTLPVKALVPPFSGPDMILSCGTAPSWARLAQHSTGAQSDLLRLKSYKVNIKAYHRRTNLTVRPENTAAEAQCSVVAVGTNVELVPGFLKI